MKKPRDIQTITAERANLEQLYRENPLQAYATKLLALNRELDRAQLVQLKPAHFTPITPTQQSLFK